jgi:hypothetical protein
MVQGLEIKVGDLLKFRLPPGTGPGGRDYFEKAGLYNTEKYFVVKPPTPEGIIFVRALSLKGPGKDIEVHQNFFEKYS